MTHLLLIAIACLAWNLASAEPYAPTALPTGGGLAKDIAETAKDHIPDKDAVEAPPYPGAKIVSAGGGSWAEYGGQRREILPHVSLVSTDPPEKVAAFYKTQLKDWHHAKEYGMFDVFWKGRKDQQNMGAPSVPTVVVSDTDGSSPDEQHLTGLKTRIDVYYQPAGR